MILTFEPFTIIVYLIIVSIIILALILQLVNKKFFYYIIIILCIVSFTFPIYLYQHLGQPTTRILSSNDFIPLHIYYEDSKMKIYYTLKNKNTNDVILFLNMFYDEKKYNEIKNKMQNVIKKNKENNSGIVVLNFNSINDVNIREIQNSSILPEK